MEDKEPIDKIVIKFEIESQRWVAPHATWFNETRDTLLIIDGKESFMDEVNRLERFRNAVLQVIESSIENWRDPEGYEPAYIMMNLKVELEDFTPLYEQFLRVEQKRAGKDQWAVEWRNGEGDVLKTFIAESGKECLPECRRVIEKITAGWLSLVEFSDGTPHSHASKGESGIN